MNEYAEKIANLDENKLSYKDTLSCCMVLGYLLKGHTDREDLKDKFDV